MDSQEIYVPEDVPEWQKIMIIATFIVACVGIILIVTIKFLRMPPF